MTERPMQRCALHATLALTLCAVAAGAVKAQTVDTIDIDLATKPGDLGTKSVQPRSSYVLELRNVLPNPNRQYRVTATVRRDTLPVLQSVAAAARDTLKPLFLPDGPDECPDPTKTRLDRAISSVLAADDEATLNAILAAADTAATRAGTQCRELITRVRRLTDSTVRHAVLPALERGQRMEITVRSWRPGGETRTWTQTLVTPPRGSWRPLYAFTFVGRAFGPQRYFSREVGPDAFVITQTRRRDWLDFVPAVFYAWMPEDADRNLVSGFTAGLGVDITEPAVFLGHGFTYNENIMVSFGLAIQQQQVLHGKYKAGDMLKTALDDQQLHGRGFRPNPYLSVGFRFGANPFSVRSDAPRE